MSCYTHLLYNYIISAALYHPFSFAWSPLDKVKCLWVLKQRNKELVKNDCVWRWLLEETGEFLAERNYNSIALWSRTSICSHRINVIRSINVKVIKQKTKQFIKAGHTIWKRGLLYVKKFVDPMFSFNCRCCSSGIKAIFPLTVLSVSSQNIWTFLVILLVY